MFNKGTNVTFLINSGATRCVKKTKGDLLNIKKDPIPFIGPIGKRKEIFGERMLQMDLGIARKKVKWPILGADFLEKFDLRIDVKKRILINKTQIVRVVVEGKNSADVITISSSDEDESLPKQNDVYFFLNELHLTFKGPSN